MARRTQHIFLVGLEGYVPLVSGKPLKDLFYYKIEFESLITDMSIFRYFYPKSSLKRKILDIRADMESVIAQICKEQFRIDWYGAYYVDPKNLVFWICVQTDQEKLGLSRNEKLLNELRNLLVIHEYPEISRPFVNIGFESQETVDRESQGDWYLHYK